MTKSFLVIGLGRFGSSLARMLTELGYEVMAVDRQMERVNELKDDVLGAVRADTTDERAVSELGVSNFDCVVICIGDDLRASILATVLCREKGAKRIIAKAQDALHKTLLLKTGADVVVLPEHDAGVRLARTLSMDGVLDSLDLPDGYSISEIVVPRDWVGNSLSGMHARTKYGISVIAIRRGGHVHVNIDPLEVLLPDDTLYVIGSDRDLERLA